jgi:hypothetical protein
VGARGCGFERAEQRRLEVGEGADRWDRHVSGRGEGRRGSGRLAELVRAGPAREGKKARARAGSVRNGSRPTGPLGLEGGRGSKNRSFPFSFSELIFEAHFQMIFKSFQLKNENHSSQKKMQQHECIKELLTL